MSQPYIGEIRIFAGNFPPDGWAFCNGATIAISTNDALFNLIGTTYGGDGENTFALPDLQGRVPLGWGASKTGQTYFIGQKAGSEAVTLTTASIPLHEHPVMATSAGAAAASPGNNLAAVPAKRIYTNGASNAQLAPGSITPAGGSQPHENMQPYLALNYIIALYGIYPQQS
ncbi:MAG: tail fiber protein [Acidobacteriota bacterium]|nr:tail fiber protein [Acidobacteriota bacterium]